MDVEPAPTLIAEIPKDEHRDLLVIGAPRFAFETSGFDLRRVPLSPAGQSQVFIGYFPGCM